jgi:RNA-binding protein
MILKGSQRRKLKALAHNLNPVVQIGQKGLTQKVVEEIDHSLQVHELIKIRFLDFKQEKKSICEDLAHQLTAEYIGMIGHVAIFYRRNSDPDQRKIEI